MPVCSFMAIEIMVRVFANGPEYRALIPCRVKKKTQNTVLDTALLNTYNLPIKGKLEQSRE